MCDSTGEDMLRIASILGNAEMDYASVVNLMQVCKDLHKEFSHRKAAPATVQFMRALFRDVFTLKCQSIWQSTSFKCMRKGVLHFEVSIEGVDHVRVCYSNPHRPYVNDLNAIVMEDGRFKGKMVYVNLRKRNVLFIDFDVAVPWYIHGRAHNVERGFESNRVAIH